MNKEKVELILEDMNSKINLILEGQDAIRSEMREGFRRINERFDLIDFNLEKLEKKIDALDLKLSNS